MMSIAHWIRTIRRRALMRRQGQLAAIVGLERSSVSDWETGTRIPSDAQIRKLGQALGENYGEALEMAAEERDFR